jgi:L-asparaginase II
MSNAVMTTATGNAIHKAAVAAIEARTATQHETPRVLVHLRQGGVVMSRHESEAEAVEERDRLIKAWTA